MIAPTRHCAYCAAMVYRWRGRMYRTQEAALAAREDERARRVTR